jgi:hypothetical protein
MNGHQRPGDFGMASAASSRRIDHHSCILSLLSTQPIMASPVTGKAQVPTRLRFCSILLLFAGAPYLYPACWAATSMCMVVIRSTGKRAWRPTLRRSSTFK